MMNTSNQTAAMVIDSIRFKDYVVIGLYVIVFLCALVANISIIYVVFKDNYLRSVTNYFLVNLSVADLLVTLVCMPRAALLAYTVEFYFGTYVCNISAYLQCIAVSSSIFTITAMAIDRYLAITRPLLGLVYRSFTKTTTVVVITILWIFSFALFSPLLFVHVVDDLMLKENVSIPVCIEQWNPDNNAQYISGIVWFVFMFVLPGNIILFTYSMMGRTLCSGKPPFDNESSVNIQRNIVLRARKRVACILLLLVLIFAICWLPHHIVILMSDMGYRHTVRVRRYLLLLGHANSALNPIIYCTLSKKFRRSMINTYSISKRFSRNRRQKTYESSGSGTQMHYLQQLNDSRSSQKFKTAIL